MHLGKALQTIGTLFLKNLLGLFKHSTTGPFEQAFAKLVGEPLHLAHVNGTGNNRSRRHNRIGLGFRSANELEIFAVFDVSIDQLLLSELVEQTPRSSALIERLVERLAVVPGE